MRERELGQRVAEAKGRLYRVGGCVRDALRGVPPHDVDYLVTGLTWEALQALLPTAVPTGLSYPVLRLTVEGTTCEVALARRERQVGPGHTGVAVHAGPEVTLAADLARRDVTVNALAQDVLTGELHDPYGGRADLAAGVLRAVSLAFTEDPLRVYRVARLAGQLGYTVAPATLALLGTMAPTLPTLSAERVWGETARALTHARPATYWRVLAAAGVVGVHYPELAALQGVPQPVRYHPEGDAWEHSLQALDAAAALTSAPHVRYAALLHDLGKALTDPACWPHHRGHEAAGEAPARRLSTRLTAPKAWREAAVVAAREHMRVREPLRPVRLVDLLTRVDRTPLRVTGLVQVALADLRGRNDPTATDPYLATLAARWAQACAAVRPRPGLTGPAVGEALRCDRAAYLRTHP